MYLFKQLLYWKFNDIHRSFDRIAKFRVTQVFSINIVFNVSWSAKKRT